VHRWLELYSNIDENARMQITLNETKLIQTLLMVPWNLEPSTGKMLDGKNSYISIIESETSEAIKALHHILDCFTKQKAGLAQLILLKGNDEEFHSSNTKELKRIKELYEELFAPENN
jgi:hypothetical protein